MGQKVNPVGFRLPVNRAWRSKWFAQKKNFGAFLVEDNAIREFVKKRLAEAGLSKMTKKEVYLEIKEVRDADADAQLVAESIAQQLERRIALITVCNTPELFLMNRMPPSRGFMTSI